MFRGKIIDGIFRIIQKRFDKDVTSLDLKYGGEWLCLGLMTISLLKKHGGFSTLEEQLSDWMRSLCKQFQFFPLLEKLYALWACSNVSSPVYNCVSEDEEREFTKEFKRNGTTLLLQRGIGSKPKKSQLEKISAMNDTGVDLVNGYFCRKVCIRDNNKTFRASDFVQAFSTASVEFSVFSHTLKHYLEELSKFKDLTIRTNGFWTLLFYATHVILIETDYMTNHDPVSSEISSFISEFCIIAGQNKAIQMADSLSEILLCVEKIEKNQPAIFMMTNILINMISSEGVLLQNDNGLGEREDLHSKLTSCSALISVLIYIDSEK